MPYRQFVSRYLQTYVLSVPFLIYFTMKRVQNRSQILQRPAYSRLGHNWSYKKNLTFKLLPNVCNLFSYVWRLWLPITKVSFLGSFVMFLMFRYRFQAPRLWDTKSQNVSPDFHPSSHHKCCLNADKRFSLFTNTRPRFVLIRVSTDRIKMNYVLWDTDETIFHDLLSCTSVVVMKISVYCSRRASQ